MYILKEDPGAGRLQLVKHDSLEQISVEGRIQSFTQADISQGHVEYSHGKGESGGSFAFKFDVVDGEGNKLIGQSFSISVLGAHVEIWNHILSAVRSRGSLIRSLRDRPGDYSDLTPGRQAQN
eukprot:bmy_20838T0